jgi:hypothetical protein
MALSGSFVKAGSFVSAPASSPVGTPSSFVYVEPDWNDLPPSYGEALESPSVAAVRDVELIGALCVVRPCVRESECVCVCVCVCDCDLPPNPHGEDAHTGGLPISVVYFVGITQVESDSSVLTEDDDPYDEEWGDLRVIVRPQWVPYGYVLWLAEELNHNVTCHLSLSLFSSLASLASLASRSSALMFLL